MKRILLSKKYRKQLDEILTDGAEGENILKMVLQKGMRILMQELTEAEVTEFLQRYHYGREKDKSIEGYRSGYEPRQVKTGEGVVQIEVPQIRDSIKPFKSKVKDFFRGNTDCVEKLAAEMYARGLSTRDQG